MNNRESQELGYFPAGLDEALTKKFGKKAKFRSEYNFFSDTRTTLYKAQYLNKGYGIKDVELYMEAFIAGNKELISRLLLVNQK